MDPGALGCSIEDITGGRIKGAWVLNVVASEQR
jgi:hypothetical protein